MEMDVDEQIEEADLDEEDQQMLQQPSPEKFDVDDIPENMKKKK